MLEELKKIPVFILRDLRILFTYKLAFSMSFLSILFNLFYLVLFGSMFGSTILPILSPYGGNFIYYILVGSVGWGFMWSIMSATSTSVSTEMMMGTLESILLTSTRVSTIMLSYAIFGGLFGLISVAILLFVGFFVFGIAVLSAATMYTLIIFILSTVMMVGFGIMFGGLTIWLKNIGDTVPFIQNVTMFFCGVYFPVEVLPKFLQPVAHFMPFYYSIEGVRKSLLPTTSFSEIFFYVEVLLCLAVITVVVGMLILRKGVDKAKKEGSLAFY
ncbi:MAG TPA: ABC transporter permease [Thermoplasmatales archaeon]|nr:ABC transporter permease [Thermoplasmatales archaeon]